MASSMPDCWQQGASGHGNSERRRSHAIALEGSGLTRMDGKCIPPHDQLSRTLSVLHRLDE